MSTDVPPSEAVAGDNAGWLRKELLPLLPSFLGYWAYLSFVGILLFVGLYLFGVRLPSLVLGIFGIICFSAGLSILLVMDDCFASSERRRGSEITYPSIVHLLLTRKTLLGILLFGGLSTLLVAYYVVSSMVAVEYTGSSGLVVRLPGHTVYYYPITSVDSWQDTGIKLQKGQLFEVGLSGKVSPGYLQNAKNIDEYFKDLNTWQKKLRQIHEKDAGTSGAEPSPPTSKILWPYTGPEGYHEDFYLRGDLANDPLGHIQHYTKDVGLTVQGLPHNTVIAIILEEGLPAPPSAEVKSNQPGYSWSNAEHRQVLINLSRQRYPLEVRAKQTGVLWVVINDADLFRIDNVGTYFLKLTTR